MEHMTQTMSLLTLYHSHFAAGIFVYHLITFPLPSSLPPPPAPSSSCSCLFAPKVTERVGLWHWMGANVALLTPPNIFGQLYILEYIEDNPVCPKKKSIEKVILINSYVYLSTNATNIVQWTSKVMSYFYTLYSGCVESYFFSRGNISGCWIWNDVSVPPFIQQVQGSSHYTRRCNKNMKHGDELR